ncbi:hypothetical protein GQ43DRAFT_135457 [Delitschia confertaspora ATCC 74209]|uniref:AA9 family lytic polysaccharide monooxygenase n=1 Tax=Delitschia confertaspora ATCC 74209 TaxID=1513339 RepID=A0A9P4MYW8_9PLEO|nr:hypothetical protein GQ43DRAFT_135457 [Delitschia confertaspora ATCC 74209]
MKTQSVFLAALAAIPSAFAHTVFTNFLVDGVSQGDAVAMRMRMDAAKASFPLEDLTSNNLACNVDGEKGVSRVQSVKDGSTLSFEFRSWPDDPSKERLDKGHKGPCAVYLKKVDSAVNDPGHGDGWFKIWDDGYNAGDSQWCTDKVIANGGVMSVVLPKGLQGGYYLARPEILALHNAANNDPQFYTGCAQIFLQSTGSLAPESTVHIPGYVKASDKALSWNIYTADNSKYPIVGPAVAKLTSKSTTDAGVNLKVQSAQTEGQKPEDCILQNGNFCFKEVPSYSDEAGCWKANENCWSQNKACWASTAPTGGSGCKIWEAKCQGIEGACSARNFNGPPNKGKDLTPKASSIEVGLVMPTSGVDASGPKIETSNEEASVPAAPTSSPSKTTAEVMAPSSPVFSAAPAKDTTKETVQKPVATPSENGHNYDTPVPTRTKQGASITTAPAAPTSAPACREGYECVTVTTTVVTTKVQYVTQWVDMKRRGIHARRNRT